MFKKRTLAALAIVAAAALPLSACASTDAAAPASDVDALTYPEQVKVARLLASPGFFRAATNSDTEVTQRSALVAREVEKVIPARDDADPWRATKETWSDFRDEPLLA